MEPYSRYLEDEFFIDWICNPTLESNAFWESYIHDNPSEKEIIETLEKLLQSLKTQDAVISNQEKQELLERILNETYSAKSKQPKIYSFIKAYYKYAAILIVAIVAGSFYLNKSQNSEELPFSNINMTALDSITNTQLTFATGEQLLIKEDKSTIRYNDLGGVVVNETDTVNNSVINKKEKLETLSTLIVPYGKRSKITLSDGTIAHLNAGTQFVFPEKFIGSKRTVFLSGEAFFEVSANKEKPFIVRTIEDKLSVEVVGTKFNVSAYPSDGEILTVLTEGKVNVVEKDVFKNRRTALIPGQLATWNKDNNQTNVKEVNTDHYTLWIEGLLYFESEPISNVIKKLERFYNINIVHDKTSSKFIDTSISGKLDLKDELKFTLENLMAITEFSFEKIDNKRYMIK